MSICLFPASSFMAVLAVSMALMSSTLADTADPVYPEDGSARIKSWYYNAKNINPYMSAEKMLKILKSEDVQMLDIKFDYEWIQDVSLFSRNGTFLVQAELPEECALGLTNGIANMSDGFLRLTRIAIEDAAKAGLTYRQMQWTFVEGGEIVTGALHDGGTYAIMGQEVLERTQCIHTARNPSSKGLSLDEAKVLIASDLGIDPSHIFSVRSSHHVDLILTALPGGTVLLSDPESTLSVLQSLMPGAKTKETAQELKTMIDVYTKGHDGRMPYDKEDVRELDEIAKALSPFLHVVRTVGKFASIRSYYGNSKMHYISDDINFFNGFLGKNAHDDTLMVTNSGRIKLLEDYWKETLGKYGIKPEHVHFEGNYKTGAGTDCIGAPSG